MEQYVFPLQKLLDIRLDKEEQSKRKFMEAQRQKMITEEKLDNMKEDYKKHNVLDNKLTTIEAKIKNNYLNALNSGIERASNELKSKMEIVEENRQDLKQKQIERKTVEIIKDKRTEAFKREQDRLEQISNDEFALYAFLRNIAVKGGE